MAENDQAAAQEWLAGWLERHHVVWDELSPAQRFLLAREIPCSVRCWRVGGPVDVKPGDKCSECGKLEPLPSFWEMIPLPV
jgi:hypothetical protein